MIQVSNEFKKAIKKSERQIKGYVEVLYDLPEINVTASANVSSSYTSLSNILLGGRVKQNYGTLDYLPLDGSYLTMDNNINSDAGFISDYNVQTYSPTARDSVDLTLSFEETTINGFTIYFVNNRIKSFIYTLSDGTQSTVVYNESKNFAQVIFEQPKTITSIEFWFTEFEYEYRKVKIDRIDLGITQVYKDQDLIEFTVDEEVNKLVEEVPTNETNIILNNMNDLFNPLNQKGILPYLSENTLIKPYIGVLTDGLGIEYVKMGEFYFDSYTNNSDATTTLVGKNILKQVEKDEITDGVVGLTSAFIDRPSDQSPNLTTDIMDRLNYNFIFNPRQKIAYYLHFLDDINLKNYLQNIAMHDYSILYASRNNQIIIRDPIGNIVDELTKNELINDAEYKKIDKINTLIKNDTRISSDGESKQGTNTTIFSSANASFILNKNTQNFAIKNESQRNVWELTNDVVFTYTGATSAEIKYGSNNYTIVQASGNVGDTVSFNCIFENHTVQSKNIGQNYEITNRGQNDKKIVLEINSIYNAFPGRVRTDLGMLEYTPSYKMTFDYNGDPSLEAGDYINVETPYGYKSLFIQKNRFKFDGGLEGSIEGVE